MRRRRRAEPLDRDRLVERVLALATKRSADARHARDALRAFRAALGTRNEANRARTASREPATALLAAARITKRLASRPEDLKAVERLLRAAASVTADVSENEGEASSRRAANVELGVLLCQEGRDAEAAALLTAMGFRYRLARGVLRYPSELAGVAVRAKKRNARDGASLLGDEDEKPTPTNDVPVRAFDGAVPPGTLARLRRVFAPDSAFWEEHGYHEDGCGFFSYAHDLTESPERFSSPRSQDTPPRSLMDAVISRVRAVAARAFPAAASATAAEWWAHSRPHASGHQMHFDSDDEGIPLNPAGSRDDPPRFIRHPICSAVVFVTGGIGGPTLVTDQRDDAKRLARNGWLVAPVTGRVAVFDGECLHGVGPGRGIVAPRDDSNESDARRDADENAVEPRRVTLMVAFWKDVEIRGTRTRAMSGSGTRAIGSFPRGSARPFPDPLAFLENDPSAPSNGVSWPRAFAVDDALLEETRKQTTSVAVAAAKEVPAVPAAAVWEDVDAERNASCFPSLSVNALRSLPAYDACFMF